MSSQPCCPCCVGLAHEQLGLPTGLPRCARVTTDGHCLLPTSGGVIVLPSSYLGEPHLTLHDPERGVSMVCEVHARLRGTRTGCNEAGARGCGLEEVVVACRCRVRDRCSGQPGDELHHAHLVQTNGESHRLAQALAGKGVMTLA